MDKGIRNGTRIVLRIAVVLAIFLTCAPEAYAQRSELESQPADTSQVWRIITVDGNEFFGPIEERTGTFIRLRTDALGVITIPLDQIRTMEVIRPDRLIGGELWADNPQAARYFWAPNGYGLNKGEGYYQNVWVFFNQLSYGISDHASIGIGLVPLFLFDSSTSPFWLTPKLSLPLDGPDGKARLGAGALVGTLVGEESGSFGITYGTFTVGSRDSNASFGVGYGYADGEWANVPALSFSAMMRTGRRTYALTENYYIDGVGIVSVGGRFVGGNLSIDYGLVLPVYDGIDVVIPWLGIVAPF